MSNFDAMFIETDMSARMRLKQATSSVATFGKFYQVGTIREAEQKLATGVSLDVIFISGNISQDDTKSFIKAAKLNPASQDCAFVLVIKNKDGDSSRVATNILVGADGLLFEPYSVDSLVEITVLASQVKADRKNEREEAAIKIVMGDIIEQISSIAQLRSVKLEASRHMKKLKETCIIFEGMEEEKRARYLEIAMDLFEKAPIPKPIDAPKYGGASSRIKKRLEDKIVAKLKAAE